MSLAESELLLIVLATISLRRTDDARAPLLAFLSSCGRDAGIGRAPVRHVVEALVRLAGARTAETVLRSADVVLRGLVSPGERTVAGSA